MTIEKEILEIIDKEIPNQLGVRLKGYLAEAQELKKRNTYLSEEMAAKIKTLEDVRVERDQLWKQCDIYNKEKESLASLKKQLDARENDIIIGEKKLYKTTTDIKLMAAEEKTALAVQLMEIAFKSPVYRRTFDKHAPEGFTNGSATSMEK